MSSLSRQLDLIFKSDTILADSVGIFEIMKAVQKKNIFPHGTGVENNWPIILNEKLLRYKNMNTYDGTNENKVYISRLNELTFNIKFKRKILKYSNC